MALGWTAPSEEELEAQGSNSEFPVLGEDEYIATVLSIELKKDVANNFPTKNDDAPTHDMIQVRGEVISFADGEDVIDKDGNELEVPATFLVWLNPKKRGMIPQPSKTRKFFAAVLGQPVSDPINVESFEDLIGRKFIVALKPNGAYNNATDFRPFKRVRTRATTARGPVEGSDMVERARGVFGDDIIDKVAEISDEDSPTNRSPAPLNTKDEDDLDF